MWLKITVSGDPAVSGLKHDQFTPYGEGATRIPGGGNAALLPPVSNPPSTAGRQGSEQRSSGILVEPPKGSVELNIYAYNTGGPIRGDNPSHAERQTVEFLDGQSEAWLQRVVSVEGIVIGRDICEHCDRHITYIKQRISKIRNDAGLPPPAFSWIRGDE